MTETMSPYVPEAPPKQRPSLASRRFGYGVAMLINAALLYAVNVWPGWSALPFLTQDTERVLGIVNASLVVAVVANAVYLAFDPRWFKAAGDALTTAVGLVAAWSIWSVFPFDFSAYSFDWTALTRILLVVGMVGSVVGVVVNLATFGRELSRRGGRPA